MLDVVHDQYSYNVFFDNLGFQAIGTVRENRFKKCPLKSSKDMKKQHRGTYDYYFDTNEEILFVKLRDNFCVSVGTNYDSVESLRMVLRYQREKKAKGLVSRPNVLKNYNLFMGGVDKHDWWKSKYSVSITSIGRFSLDL